MRTYYLLAAVFTFIASNIQALKCRTREHMKQQQDFYSLASSCMKASMNITQSNNEEQWNYRRQRPRLHQGNRQHDDNRYSSNQYHDNRYDHNKMNFGHSDDETRPKQPNTCVTEDGYDNRHSGYTDESRPSRYQRKRDSISTHKYVRKNMTNISSKKSPLEDIGACVIHCIFREMKMLNSDSKVDKQAMISLMTNRIVDPELKEFIQDSIEECFDILDSDNHEEQCDFSKTLTLCLEEKAKHSCEDWEIRENSTITSNVNFSKDLDNQNNENQNTNNQDGYFNKNGFSGRRPSFSLGQRKN